MMYFQENNQTHTAHADMLRGLTLVPPKLHLKLNMELLKETNPYNTVMQPAKAAIYTWGLGVLNSLSYGLPESSIVPS